MTAPRTPTFRQRLGAGCALVALLPMLMGPAAPAAWGQAMKDSPSGKASPPPQHPSTGGGMPLTTPASPDAAAGPPPPPPSVAAQPAQDADPLQEAQDIPDPPTRVGRIARLQGTVSFRMPEQDDWVPAEQNFSVTTGNAIWTEPGARAAVQVGRTNLVLDGGTDLQFAVIDESTVLATLPQGTVYARLRELAPGETVQLVTPRAQVTLDQPGRYLIEAGPGPDAPPAPMRVAVYQGSAVIAVEGLQPTRLSTGQAVLFPPEGEAPPQIIRASAVGSPLIAWAAQLEPRVAPPRSAALMTGVDDLGLQGRWTRNAEYGDVWYPPVEPGWSPYSAGRWTWRDPWGWTWVDDHPWGYTTSHYGRWVQIGPSWAWAPAPVVVAEPAYVVAPRPVWAPALVTFVGGVALGAAFASWSRPVAWIPLGPREPYYPWYRASPAYVRNLNIRQVPHITQVTNTWNQIIVNRRALLGRPPGPGGLPGGVPGLDPQRLVNRRATVAVPAETMIGSRPVRPVAQRVAPGALTNVAPQIGAPPVPPARQTLGVTPRTAQRLGLPPATPGGGPGSAAAAAGAAVPRAPGPTPDRHAPLLGRARTTWPASAPGPGGAGRGGGPQGPAPAGPPGGPDTAPRGGPSGAGAIAGAAAAGAAAGAVGGALMRPGSSAPRPGASLTGPGGVGASTMPLRPGQPGALGGPPAASPGRPPGAGPAGLARPGGGVAPGGGGPGSVGTAPGGVGKPGGGPFGPAAGGPGGAAGAPSPLRPGRPGGRDGAPPSPGGPTWPGSPGATVQRPGGSPAGVVPGIGGAPGGTAARPDFSRPGGGGGNTPGPQWGKGMAVPRPGGPGMAPPPGGSGGGSGAAIGPRPRPEGGSAGHIGRPAPGGGSAFAPHVTSPAPPQPQPRSTFQPPGNSGIGRMAPPRPAPGGSGGFGSPAPSPRSGGGSATFAPQPMAPPPRAAAPPPAPRMSAPPPPRISASPPAPRASAPPPRPPHQAPPPHQREQRRQ